MISFPNNNFNARNSTSYHFCACQIVPNHRRRTLGDVFSTIGELEDVCVVMDRDEPTRSRGFGFVTFKDPAAAQEARLPLFCI